MQNIFSGLIFPNLTTTKSNASNFYRLLRMLFRNAQPFIFALFLQNIKITWALLTDVLGSIMLCCYFFKHKDNREMQWEMSMLFFFLSQSIYHNQYSIAAIPAVLCSFEVGSVCSGGNGTGSQCQDVFMETLNDNTASVEAVMV